MTEGRFVPLNAIEFVVADAMAGRRSIPELVRALVSSSVTIPSATEPKADGSGFTPITYDKEGVPMVAIFTDSERAKSLHAKAPFCLVIRFGGAIARFPAGCGIVDWKKGTQLDSS